MKLNKFPVTSKMGYEYLVKIKDNSYFWVVDVIIYHKGKIINKKLESYCLTKNSKYWFLHDNPIALTEHFIEQYEKGRLEEIVKYKYQQEKIKEFQEWDGNCE